MPCFVDTTTPDHFDNGVFTELKFSKLGKPSGDCGNGYFVTDFVLFVGVKVPPRVHASITIFGHFHDEVDNTTDNWTSIVATAFFGGSSNGKDYYGTTGGGIHYNDGFWAGGTSVLISAAPTFGHPNPSAHIDFLLTDFIELQLLTGAMGDGGASPPNPPPNPPETELDGEGNLKLTWDDGSLDEVGFAIEESKDGGPFEFIGFTPTDVTEFLVGAEGLETGHTYAYRVSSFKEDGRSAPTAPSDTVDYGGEPGCDTVHDLPWALSLSPDTGLRVGGTVVTINGVVTDAINPATLEPYQLKVTIGGVQVTPTIVDENTISIVAPPHEGGTVNVTVWRPETGDSVTLVNGYEYIGSTAGITSIETTTGPTTGGTVVRVLGFGFVPGSQVVFGSVPSPGVTFVSANELQAITPPNQAGTVEVSVITP